MKIQIKSLHIVDCGPIKDAVFDFADENGVPRDTTLMTGANGSGKTTILKLILALAGGLLKIQETSRSTKNRFSPAQYRNILSRTRYARMDWLVDGEPFSFVSGSEVGWSAFEESGIRFIGDAIEPVLSKHGIPAQRIIRKIRDQQFSHGFIPQGEDRISGSPDLVPSILYFPHVRELPTVDGKRIEQEEVKYQWIYAYQSRDQYQGSLNSYLIWLDYAHPDQFEAARSVMNSLYSDGKKFEIDRPRLKVIVRTRDGGTHDLEYLSSGEQNILITLIELRRRLMPHSIVLIDEIENSLHQDYQFRFGFALQALQKEVPFQLIVTSHVSTFSRIFGYENTLILPAPGTYGRLRQTTIK